MGLYRADTVDAVWHHGPTAQTKLENCITKPIKAFGRLEPLCGEDPMLAHDKVDPRGDAVA